MSSNAIQQKLEHTADVTRVPSGYTRTELGVLPGDWNTRALGEIGQCLIGLTYDPENVTPDGLLVLRSSNIGDGRLQFDDNVFVDMVVPERIIVREDDLLICVRNGSRSLIGKCALIDKRAAGMTFGAFMGVFRSSGNRFVFYCFQSDIVKRQIHEHLGATINQITNRSLNSFKIPFPEADEQRAIAEALSDVDGLIGALEALIAKKRAIQQAAMQQLLTGKIRLPGFTGKWQTKRLGEISTIAMGRTPSRSNTKFWGRGHVWLSIADLQGKVVDESKEQITDLAAATMTPIPKGTLLMSFKLSIGRLCFAGCDLFTNEAICSFTDLQADADYLYYALGRTDFALYGKQAVKGYTLNSESLKLVEVTLPGSAEQEAIAAVLSDMDAEIAALERRRDKTKQIKQGMMQQLLTGRIRLVKPEAPAVQTETERKGSEGHNWAFNEAVVISTLVRHFGSERFPLGRMRYTKLSYLLHRHVEKQAEGYLKKAAGPYNPKTRYAGPEKIAKQNGYIKQHKGPQGHSGFIVAAKLKRDYILIELNERYANDIARPRLAHVETGVTVTEQRAGQLPLFAGKRKENQ